MEEGAEEYLTDVWSDALKRATHVRRESGTMIGKCHYGEGCFSLEINYLDGRRSKGSGLSLRKRGVRGQILILLKNPLRIVFFSSASVACG